MTNLLPPAIKWSGSKRLQALQIIQYFPEFDTYYEPFVGGAAVVAQLAPRNAVCGDICAPLMEFWRVVQKSPHELVDAYTSDWIRLQNEGWRVFYEIRDRFNSNPNPFDLLFLSRTCVNGLIRFNKQGEFNNSLHYTRAGINPARLKEILLEWSERLRNVTFANGDYKEIAATASIRDFVYLDPPYFYTKGRFYGGIDFGDFLEFLGYLKSKGVRYAVSFDGSVGNQPYEVDFPPSLYEVQFLLNSGNSTFPKVMKGSVRPVRESLYLSSKSMAKRAQTLTDFSRREESLQTSREGSPAELITVNR